MAVDGLVAILVANSDMDAIRMVARVCMNLVYLTISAAVNIGLGEGANIQAFMRGHAKAAVNLWVRAKGLGNDRKIRRPEQVERFSLLSDPDRQGADGTPF